MTRLALVVGVGLALSCSNKTISNGECTSNEDCAAGEVCDGGSCESLCRSDTDCPRGQVCRESFCIDGVSDTPEIWAVDSNGPADGATDHTDHHLLSHLTIVGANLEGAAVSLDDGSNAYDLEVCSQSAEELEVKLPDELLAGTYSLKVENQSGSCASQLPILQGIQGPEGPMPTIYGDITAVVAGNGLTGGGDTDSVTLDVDTSVVQARVTDACPGGIQSIAQNGDATCRPESPNDTYIHWGYATCADGDEVLYAGTAYGNWYNHGGGPTKPICYEDGDLAPQYDQASHGSYYVALGTYFSNNDTQHQVPGVTGRRSIPCAQCATTRVCYEAIGTDQCASGWTAAYSGLLAGSYYAYAGRTDSFCYEVNNDAPETPHANLNQIFSGSTGAPDYMAGGVLGYRHTKCAICCK